MVDSSRVWEVSFLDLGQTNYFQISVEGDMVRGWPDLQNPAVVWLEIKQSVFLVIFLFFYYNGIFSV